MLLLHHRVPPDCSGEKPISKIWRFSAMSVKKAMPRCSVRRTRRCSVISATTASTMPISSLRSTGDFPSSAHPRRRPPSATSAGFGLRSEFWLKFWGVYSVFPMWVWFDFLFLFWNVIYFRSGEVSCSVSRTERFCAESAMIRFIRPTNSLRSTTGFFWLVLSSPPLPLCTRRRPRARSRSEVVAVVFLIPSQSVPLRTHQPFPLPQ